MKYTEYKKRVAHANAGGAIQREMVSMVELIPSHVQKVFARVYHESRTITATQLVVCLLYTSPSPRDKRQSRMPSSA